MTILFNRVATIIAQHPDHPDITIQNLRIQFDVEKFHGAALNSGTITVYNLKPENRRLLVKRKSDFESAPFTTITLIAGYEGSASIIFRGQLVQGFSTRSGPDWITTLQCVTAFDQAVSAHHGPEDSFEEITAFDLLQRFLSAMSLTARLDPDDLAALQTERIKGAAYSGRVIDSVSTILARYKLQIDYDDFEAFIAKAFAPVNPEDEFIAPLISKATGLIGSPRITEVGVMLTSLLNNQIQVVKLFRVDSETTKQNDIRGQEIQTFTCTKLKHAGDTHSDTWQSEVAGAWYPLLGFIGSKNTVPIALNEPAYEEFPPDANPPLPGPPT